MRKFSRSTSGMLSVLAFASLLLGTPVARAFGGAKGQMLTVVLSSNSSDYNGAAADLPLLISMAQNLVMGLPENVSYQLFYSSNNAPPLLIPTGNNDRPSLMSALSQLQIKNQEITEQMRNWQYEHGQNDPADLKGYLFQTFSEYEHHLLFVGLPTFAAQNFARSSGTPTTIFPSYALSTNGKKYEWTPGTDTSIPTGVVAIGTKGDYDATPLHALALGSLVEKKENLLRDMPAFVSAFASAFSAAPVSSASASASASSASIKDFHFGILESIPTSTSRVDDFSKALGLSSSNIQRSEGLPPDLQALLARDPRDARAERSHSDAFEIRASLEDRLRQYNSYGTHFTSYIDVKSITNQQLILMRDLPPLPAYDRNRIDSTSRFYDSFFARGVNAYGCHLINPAGPDAINLNRGKEFSIDRITLSNQQLHILLTNNDDTEEMMLICGRNLNANPTLAQLMSVIGDDFELVNSGYRHSDQNTYGIANNEYEYTDFYETFFETRANARVRRVASQMTGRENFSSPALIETHFPIVIESMPLSLLRHTDETFILTPGGTQYSKASTADVLQTLKPGTCAFAIQGLSSDQIAEADDQNRVPLQFSGYNGQYTIQPNRIILTLSGSRNNSAQQAILACEYGLGLKSTANVATLMESNGFGLEKNESSQGEKAPNFRSTFLAKLGTNSNYTGTTLSDPKLSTLGLRMVMMQDRDPMARTQLDPNGVCNIQNAPPSQGSLKAGDLLSLVSVDSLAASPSWSSTWIDSNGNRFSIRCNLNPNAKLSDLLPKLANVLEPSVDGF